MEKKLKVKYSQFKTDLSFNEWVKEVNFGRDYTPPTPYFQGNIPRHHTLFESVDRLTPDTSLTEKIIQKFKIKLKTKWREKTN